MNDGSGDGRSDRAPFFPAPRGRADANAPYRAAAPSAALAEAPREDRPIVVTRPSAAPIVPPASARPAAALSPYRPSEDEIRAEVLATAGTRTYGLPTRRYLAALMVPHAKWLGGVFLAAGLCLVGYQLIFRPVTNGPAAIVIGLGWILADRISMTRPMLRIGAMWGLMVGGIFFEGWLKTMGWLAR